MISLAIEDRQALKAGTALFDVELERLGNEMIKTVQSDFEQVVLGIVGDSKKADPLRLNRFSGSTS